MGAPDSVTIRVGERATEGLWSPLAGALALAVIAPGAGNTMRNPYFDGIVDGLLSGWHEPRASHLLMLEAVAGRALLERAYAEAVRHGYLWHEFGDLHLTLP